MRTWIVHTAGLVASFATFTVKADHLALDGNWAVFVVNAVPVRVFNRRYVIWIEEQQEKKA